MPDMVQNISVMNSCDEYIRCSDMCLEIHGVRLLANINCHIPLTGTTLVMGPNGAGKSLFLRILAQLLVPTSGNFIIHGNRNEKADPSNRQMQTAILFQQPVLLRRTVRQNIEFVLRRHPHLCKNIGDHLDKALHDARLSARADISARFLSGGEKQRLALVRALATKPRVLLLDEVTASLDPASMHLVETRCIEAAKQGTKIIFISHDVRQAKRLADDVMFLHEGRVLVHKSAKTFFREPGSFEAQAYLDGRIATTMEKE